MIKCQHLIVFLIDLRVRVDIVNDLRRMIQDILHTAAAFQRTRHRHDHHLRHHDEEQHHHGILDDGSDVVDLQDAAADVSAAHPVDDHDEQVDEEE